MPTICIFLSNFVLVHLIPEGQILSTFCDNRPIHFKQCMTSLARVPFRSGGSCVLTAMTAMSSAHGHRMGVTESFIHSRDTSQGVVHDAENGWSQFSEEQQSGFVTGRLSARFPGTFGKRNIPFGFSVSSLLMFP